MPTFANISGQEPSTVSFRAGTVQLTRGSTAEHQEILVLGDPDTSNAIAAVTNAAPASTRWGANVRIVSGPSSVADLAVRAVLPSPASDNVVNVSSVAGVVAAALTSPISSGSPGAGDSSVIVRQVGSSTVAAVASVAGVVAVRNSDTNFASSAGFHFDSSGALQIAIVSDAVGSAVDTEDYAVAR